MAVLKDKRGNKRQGRPGAIVNTSATRISNGMYVSGFILLAACVGTSLVLVLDYWDGFSLPGCGPGSGCAEAAASVWGTVPYINWPVSFLGLAYFTGLLGVWLISRAGIAPALRMLVRLGVLISLGFIAIMIVEGHVCQYCTAAHIGNILFWILLENSAKINIGSLRALGTVGAVFLICSGVLAGAEFSQRKDAATKAEAKLSSSTEAIIAATSQRTVEGSTESERVTNADEPGDDAASGGGFAGRYRLGPEKAAIRVVMISDYQCRECRRIENDVIRIFRRRDDMSVSYKHFPMSTHCNRKAKTNRHPNACWAARAAETAGILKGNDGFWEMHFWLFEEHGSFTQKTLPSQLRKFGYDAQEFTRIMMSDETLEPVKADVEEAIGLGIWFTPTTFINGVELRGWEAPRAIERAIEQLAATNPEPMTASHDQPPPAFEKLVGDWRAQPERTIPPTTSRRTLGPEQAAVRVVMFGDYQQEGAVETDRVLREIVAAREDMRYEYRYFPFHKDCNPVVTRETEYVNSCLAARAGEAAGRLGEAESYWKMHAWLMENRARFSEQTLSEAAAAIDVEPAVLSAEMAKPETAAAVRDATLAGRRIGANSVPCLYINGKRLQRWKIEDKNVLAEIVAEAAK